MKRGCFMVFKPQFLEEYEYPHVPSLEISPLATFDDTGGEPTKVPLMRM